jgi:fatty acid-binding protein DegV
MNKTTIVAALGLGILSAVTSGCGKSKALTAAEEYEKATCACKDTTCVTNATTKFSESAKDMATASGGEAEAIAKATTAASECSTKVMMASIPGAPKK